MKKAITVTEQNKSQNPRYLKNKIVGSIIVFTESTFPKVWTIKNYIELEGEMVLDPLTSWTKERFDKATEFHEEAGFYPVVTPVYDSSTQYLTTLFFNVNQFIYGVANYTPEELQQIQENQINQIADGEESTRRTDGEDEARYIYRMLRKLKNNGTLNHNQFIQAQGLLFDALIPMASWGLWEVSESRLNNISNPANATLLNVLNQIRARVSHYVSNGVRDVELKAGK